MRIASYNIRKGLGLDGRRSPERILEVISDLDADVVVLQEADRRLGDRPAALPHALIETESDFDVAPVSENDVSLGWHGNAILVRRGIRIDAVERFDLPGLEPRGAVAITLNDVMATRVVGVHLGLLRTSRRKQLEVLRDRLDDASRPQTVIAGDFNEWSARKAHEPLAPAYAMAACMRSFPAAYPLATLDRIAHGPGLRIADAGVCTNKDAQIASDHLPIWADMATTV